MVGTFWGQKSLKALSNKVFRFIQQTLFRFLIHRQWGNMEAINDYGPQQAKIVAAERRYDWDTMTEEEKEEFIDEIVHEK